MASNTPNHSFEWRAEIVFNDRRARLRERRFWREITLSDMAGASIESAAVAQEHGKSDFYFFDQGFLRVSDRTVWIVGYAANVVTGLTALVLQRLPEVPLENLLFQKRTPGSVRSRDANAAREFKKQMAQLKSLIGERLGPAVVVDETALFHAVATKVRPSVSERQTVLVTMGRLAPAVERDLQSTMTAVTAQILTILDLDFQESLREFRFAEYAVNDQHRVLIGEAATEFLRLSLWKTRAGLAAGFEYQAREPNLAVLSQVCQALLPRDLQVDAFAKGVVACADGWCARPLGANDTRSVWSRTGWPDAAEMEVAPFQASA